jgi:valyl-tRNA synthetase
VVQHPGADAAAACRAEEATIRRLAKISEVSWGEGGESVGGYAVLPDGTGVFVPLGDAIDVARECERLGAEIARLQQLVLGQERKLANEQFVARAPAEVVGKEREKLATWREQVTALQEKRGRLGC